MPRLFCFINEVYSRPHSNYGISSKTIIHYCYLISRNCPQESYANNILIYVFSFVQVELQNNHFCEARPFGSALFKFGYLF